MTAAPSAGPRAMRRCDELAALSALPGRIDRYHLTAEHQAANDLVGRWLEEAGLRTWVDAAGNRWGRLEGPQPGAPALVLGSHTDTVPDAGRYDGPLGVVLGIEVAERVQAGEPLPFALEVVAFSDEEGTRFGCPLMGSRAVAGTWDEAWWGSPDPSGVTVAQAFRAFGLDPAQVSGAVRAPDELVGYLEAHIEQGPRLESKGLALGVVDVIAGARRLDLAVLGEARHGGGTPYLRRRDALIGAAELAIRVRDAARAAGAIATVGRFQAYPGGVNVVPGRVELSLDVRAGSDEVRDQVLDRILDEGSAICVRHGLRLVAEETHEAAAVGCAAWLADAVAEGIRASGQEETPALLSWAGHDAMAIAGITDIGMLFVRCEDGVSHNPDEAVAEEDVTQAADAFEAAVRAVARRWAAGEGR